MFNIIFILCNSSIILNKHNYCYLYSIVFIILFTQVQQVFLQLCKQWKYEIIKKWNKRKRRCARCGKVKFGCGCVAVGLHTCNIWERDNVKNSGKISFYESRTEYLLNLSNSWWHKSCFTKIPTTLKLSKYLTN